MVTKKKLTGLKKGFSSFENKKLKNLQSVQGGVYLIRSEVDCGEGCVEYDVYSGPNGTGEHKGRRFLTVGPVTSVGVE